MLKNCLVSMIFSQSEVSSVAVTQNRIRKTQIHFSLQKLIEFLIESNEYTRPMCSTLLYKTTKYVLEFKKNLSQVDMGNYLEKSGAKSTSVRG